MHHTFLKYPKSKEYSLHHTYYLIFIFYNTELIWRKAIPTWGCCRSRWRCRIHICLDSVQKIWIIIMITDPGCNQIAYNGLCETCPYSDIFWSVFSPNAEKYGQGKLRKQTLFTERWTSVLFIRTLSIMPFRYT